MRLSSPLTSLVVAIAALGAVPAMADGSFVQLDFAETASGAVVAVVAVTRGALNFGLGYSAYEGGDTKSASITYSLPLDVPGTIKLGPSLAQACDDETGCDDWEPGIKLSYERYIATQSGHVFLLGEVNSIDRNWFALAQFGVTPAVNLELSAGGSENYDAASVAISYRIGAGPVSLRAGYKFVAQEVFVGLSVNTF